MQGIFNIFLAYIKNFYAFSYKKYIHLALNYDIINKYK